MSLFIIESKFHLNLNNFLSIHVKVVKILENVGPLYIFFIVVIFHFPSRICFPAFLYYVNFWLRDCSYCPTFMLHIVCLLMFYFVVKFLGNLEPSWYLLLIIYSVCSRYIGCALFLLYVFNIFILLEKIISHMFMSKNFLCFLYLSINFDVNEFVIHASQFPWYYAFIEASF